MRKNYFHLILCLLLSAGFIHCGSFGLEVNDIQAPLLDIDNDPDVLSFEEDDDSLARVEKELDKSDLFLNLISVERNRSTRNACDMLITFEFNPQWMQSFKLLKSYDIRDGEALIRNIEPSMAEFLAEDFDFDPIISSTELIIEDDNSSKYQNLNYWIEMTLSDGTVLETEAIDISPTCVGA